MNKEQIETYVKTQSPWRDHPGDWYQDGLELPFGITLKSPCVGADCREIWDKLHLVPSDIEGKTVLDIGCNTGYYAMRTMEEGAKNACGIDKSGWLPCGRQFAEWKGIAIEWADMDFYDFDWSRKFDLVFCLQVIYHLNEGQPEKDILEPLRVIANSCNETLLLFTNIRSELYTEEMRLKHFQHNAYVPSLREITQDLSGVGFKVMELDFLHDGVGENVIKNGACRVGKVGIKAKRK